jgi:hypothetical protein
MADRKISDLTALTTPASGDFLPIVDISEVAAASKNKRVTIQSLFQGIPVNVGIGISSPVGKLNVAGYSSTDIQQDIHITRSSSGTGIQTGPNLTLSTGTATDAIALQGTQGRFGIWNYASSSWVERFCVTGPGNVGIGNTAPGAQLEINGGVSRTDYWTPAGKYSAKLGLVTGTDTDIYAGITGSYQAGTSANLILQARFSDLGTVNGVVLKNSTSDTGGLAICSLLATSGGAVETERARIDSSGRVLIGTSSDSGGALLQVNDNRIRIATANTPASAGATGTTGEIAWDADYIYVCTAANTWKRTAISTW